jgi:MFS family permease
MTEVVRYLLSHKAVYGPMFIGLALSAMNLFGVIAWTPSFLQRSYGWRPQDAGLYLGLTSLVASPLGLVVGTWLNGVYTRQRRDDANLRVLMIAQVIRVPAAIAAPLMPDPVLALACFGLVNFSGMMGAPSQNAALQIITPNEMRGQVTALYLFMFSVIGSGLGPSSVALITQYVLRSESRLGEALAISSAILGPLSAAILWSGVKPYAGAIARLRQTGN